MDIRHSIAAELPRLRRYARALSAGDTSHADDLVQHALERALNKAHLFQPGTNLRAWLFTILHNVSVSEHRKRAARPYEVSDETTPESAYATPPDAHGKLALRDMARALERLPQEQRETVLLVSLEGLSYKEVSEVMAVPIGTVMSRLARGRDQLRTLMESGVEKTMPRSMLRPTLWRVK